MRIAGDEVRSFYHLAGASLSGRACQGTACFLARRLRPECWAPQASPRVYCLGKCYVAPAVHEDTARPALRIHSRVPVVLERIVRGPQRTLDSYRSAGGFDALARRLREPPETFVREVLTSGLRGRGGAGFPTGIKLRSVAAEPGAGKVVVANGDEGDPGAYIDRVLLEDDPFAVLEGLLLAGYAVGANRGVIYVRAEYPDAQQTIEAALVEARSAGVLGPSVLGASFAFDVELVRGLGSYVCGEETALLNSIEGRRPFVRSRPPYPSRHGLFGKPTLIQNVETLVNLPWIARHGGAAYSSLGYGHSRGTKLVSLSSLFTNPGLYEVELGTPLRTIVEVLGGGLRTGALKGVMIGGPLAGVLPPSLLDLPLDWEALKDAGAGVGHGGVMAIDDTTSLPELIAHVFEFAAYESCGECTPCRLGARAVADRFTQLLARRRPEFGAFRRFEQLASTLRATSLCGHGGGLGEFASSLLRHHRKELEACFD